MKNSIRHRSLPGHDRSAFTLIELLVVMGIIGILAVAVVSGGNSVTSGLNLSGGAGMVVDNLANARQTAMSRNVSVQVRFFETTNGDSPDPDNPYFDTVAVVLMGSTPEYLGKPQRLPDGIIIDSDIGVSSIAGMARSTAVRAASGTMYPAL